MRPDKANAMINHLHYLSIVHFNMCKQKAWLRDTDAENSTFDNPEPRSHLD